MRTNLSWRPPNLVTPRLVLRAFTERDIEPLFLSACNPNVTRFTLWEAHQSLDDSALFIREYALCRYYEGVPEPFAIALRSDVSTPVGAIGCYWASRPNHTMELGYWIAERFWGQGLVCEAIAALLAYVVDEFDPRRIQARVIVGNSASVRVLEKCGFAYEGTLRSSRYRRGGLEDVMMFARVREEDAIIPAPAPG